MEKYTICRDLIRNSVSCMKIIVQMKEETQINRQGMKGVE